MRNPKNKLLDCLAFHVVISAIIVLALLLVAVFGYSQDTVQYKKVSVLNYADVPPPDDDDTIYVPPPDPGSCANDYTKLVRESTFELPRYFWEKLGVINGVHAIENCNPTNNNGGDTAHGTQYDWTLRRVSDTVFACSNAVRFEIQKGQPLVGSAQRVRSEVTIWKPDEDTTKAAAATMTDMWYSFAIYFPAYGAANDPQRCAINQWFEDGSKEMTIRTHGGKCYLEVTPDVGGKYKRFDLYSTAQTFNETTTGFVSHPLDEWHEFVFHIKHSLSSDGLVEVWRDGTKIHTYNGRTMHLKLPKWKVGLYGTQNSNENHKVVFFDNIRLGGPNANEISMSTPAE